jgi:GTP-binding protein Era
MQQVQDMSGNRIITGLDIDALTVVVKVMPVHQHRRLYRHQAIGDVDSLMRIGFRLLLERLGELMPPGPLLYPTEERSDQPSEVHLAELIREQVLRRTREELPHAVEVELVEAIPRDDGLIDVRADIWAESGSQKAILVGKGGKMIRAIGSAARKELERELDARVFLDLQVKVRARWRRDESLLDRLGID